MTLYLGVNSNTTASDIQYVADIMGKSYRSVGSIGDLCDSSCREIVEATVISSVLVPGAPGEDEENIFGCAQTMKVVLEVEGFYAGCASEDFPGLFGVPESIAEEGKRQLESSLPSFIRGRRHMQEEQVCACQDFAISITEDAHQESLIEEEEHEEVS